VNDLRTQFSGPLRLLLMASGLLLGLVCANLASLTLARNRLRVTEVTVRLALGASRGRLIRQLFTESFVLAATAGAAGATIGLSASRALVALLSRGRTPIVLSLGPSVRMLLATVVMTLLAGLLFGLWPALRASRTDLQAGLKAGVRTVARAWGTRWNVLIAVQAALSIVLVVAGALFGRSLARLYASDIGMAKGQVMFLSVGAGMVGAANGRPAAMDAFYDRLSSAPGITSLSTALDLPFRGASSYLADVSVLDQPADAHVHVGFNFVGARFFQTLGIPLLAGRDIGETDDAGHPLVVVISQSLARRLFQTSNPIGRKLAAESKDIIEVVGVAKDVPYESVRSERELMLYRPARQAWTGQTTVAVRTTASPAVVATLARRALHDLGADAPVSITSASDQFDGSIATERLLADIAAFLGLMSLLLVAIGMYGTLANSLAQRTREFGVRRALGATDGRLVRTIVAHALAPVGLGVVVGLPAALAVARLGGAMLFEITPRDPATYLLSMGVLILTAFLAAAIPSRSAARGSVIAALREG
jgi:predicted permease